MDALEAILTRKSVRNYTGDHIGDDILTAILTAGMSGPSCVNSREWAFIVVRDRNILEAMADANGAPAAPLKGADVGIMVCGDMERAFKPAPDYWIIDCAIAGQNMIIAAKALGVGSVWLGTYPQMDRVKRQTELFHLPKSIIPHSIIAFGYEDAGNKRQIAPDLPTERSIFEPERVHYEKW